MPETLDKLRVSSFRLKMVPTGLEPATPTLSNLSHEIKRVKFNSIKLKKPDLIRFSGQSKTIQLNKINTKK